MVLVKCKCGCFYTLNQIGLTRNVDMDRKCPNCRADHKLSSYRGLDTMEPIPDDTIKIEVIPENAKIRVSFDV